MSIISVNSIPVELTIELPWPPSDNRLVRHVVLPKTRRAVAFPSDEAKDYYEAVHTILLLKRLPLLHGPLAMHVEFYPPTRREIDGPNRWKALMDSLKRREKGRRHKGCKPKWDPHQKAWLFARDDSQVVEWGGKLCHVVPGGKAVVTFTPLVLAGSQVEMFESV